MTARLLITFGVLIYAGVVPWLEINDTHVFNPEWPPHARLHEVWQLITNSALGAFCLWRCWGRADIRLPAILALMIMGGFLAALALADQYGGSMVLREGGIERTVLGLNLGVIGGLLVVISAVTALALDTARRR
jgi:hypothetical protein